MRRWIGVLAVTITLCWPAYAEAAHNLGRRAQRCHGIQGIVRLIRCEARVFRSPGGPSKAVAVARCESNLNPSVRGGSNNHYVGLFQWYEPNWAEIARKWVRPVGLHNLRWQNPEANTIAAVRLARSLGTWEGYWACG